MVGKYKMTNDEFLHKVNAIKPDIDVLEPYRGVDGKIQCRCKVCQY